MARTGVGARNVAGPGCQLRLLFLYFYLCIRHTVALWVCFTLFLPFSSSFPPFSLQFFISGFI